MNAQEKKFTKLLDKLQDAIEKKNESLIVECFDDFKHFDLMKISGSLIDEYDELVDKGNLIICQIIKNE